MRGGETESNDNTSYGFVDRQGQLAIEPRFGEAHPFSEGFAVVRTRKTTVYGMGDSWGYIDKRGNYRIKPHFNEAWPFKGGVAKVHLGGTLREVTDMPSYWEGGAWWLIDAAGKLLRRL
jgi:hypothetical protein